MLKITSFGDVTRYDLARTLAGRGRYWTTAYLVDGLLIDSGCAHSASELAAALSERTLIGIVNTHSHEDHIGANGRLQDRQAGLKIQAHRLALPVLADPRRQQPLHPYRRLMWGWPQPSQGQSVSEGEGVKTDRYRFQVINTPGHSPDHICLYEPDQGWLFSGDLFVGGRERALRADYEIWQIITSLKRVLALSGLGTLFPGCAHVRENAREALEDKIAYLEELGDQILAMHQQGRSERDIVRTLLGKWIWIETITLGHFSRKWLVRSYLRRGATADSYPSTTAGQPTTAETSDQQPTTSDHIKGDPFND